MREAMHDKLCGVLICCLANLLPDSMSGWYLSVSTCTKGWGVYEPAPEHSFQCVCIHPKYVHVCRRVTHNSCLSLLMCLCVLFVCAFLCIHNFMFAPHPHVCDQPFQGVSGHFWIEDRQVWHIRNLVPTCVSRPLNCEYPSVTNSKTEGGGDFPFQWINDFPILTQFSFGIQDRMQQDINLQKSAEKLGHLWAIHFIPPKKKT